MKKYSHLDNMALMLEVAKILHPNEEETFLAELVDSGFMPAYAWEDCYPVMDELLKIITGVKLNSDGSATGLIGGKEQTVTGGHCRAICILFLMAKDEGKNS